MKCLPRFVWMVPMFVIGAMPASADLLIVLNKSDNKAALVDPSDRHKVVARLKTGRAPHEVAVTPDGHWAFVSNYGMSGVFNGKRRDEPGNTLTVLDLERRKVARTITLPAAARPHGIATSRDGALVWVTCEGMKSVLELDAKSGNVLSTWPTAQETSHMIVASPDERRLYVANIGSGSVTVIDRQSGAVHSVPTGDGPEGIDISPDGREVWVANRGANLIAVLDARSDSVVARFNSGGMMPIRVKFTPDGRQVWVSNARTNRVVVFDPATRQIIKTIAVGAMPVGIQMEPSGMRAYVANTNDNSVTVIDVSTRTVMTTFAPGKEPDGMAWAPVRKSGK
jgi:YVTN family beta-propeller protein